MPRKKREFTDKERRDHRMTIDILNGMDFTQAAAVHNIGTRQAAQKCFRKYVVNLFLTEERELIKESKFSLSKICQLWAESHIKYLQV